MVPQHPGVFAVNTLVLVLGLIAALGPLSIDMYLPVLPSIASSLNTSESAVQLSLAAYFLGLSLGQLVYGPLSDTLGRRKPLLAGLALYVVASLGCAWAPTIETLIAFRFIQALGGCAGVVISRAIVRDLFTQQEAARVFSRLMLIMGAAPIIAPLLGSALVAWNPAGAGWRSLFVVLAGVGLVTFVCSAKLIQETLRKEFFSENERGVPEKRSLLATYVSLARDGTFMAYALAGGLAQAGMFAYITGSPFVFMNHFQFGATAYAWLFGANALGLIAASQWNSRLLRTNSSESILGGALVGLAIAGAALVNVSSFNVSALVLAVPLFLYVATLGLTFPNAAACALANQGHRAGSASALLGTLQFVIASVASGAVSALREGSSRGMAAVIGTCGLLALATFFLGRPQTKM